MTAPTQKVRAATYLRDLHRCVACGATDALEWNHRENSGSGGRGRKAAPVTPADGVTMCHLHNGLLESDSAFRQLGLQSGWKLLRFRQVASDGVPYRDAVTGLWWLPDTEGFRHQVTVVEAMRRLRSAGSVAA